MRRDGSSRSESGSRNPSATPQTNGQHHAQEPGEGRRAPAPPEHAEVDLEADHDEQQDDGDGRVPADHRLHGAAREEPRLAARRDRARATVGPSTMPAAISPTTIGIPSHRASSPRRRADAEHDAEREEEDEAVVFGHAGSFPCSGAVRDSAFSPCGAWSSLHCAWRSTASSSPRSSRSSRSGPPSSARGRERESERRSSPSRSSAASTATSRSPSSASRWPAWVSGWIGEPAMAAVLDRAVLSRTGAPASRGLAHRRRRDRVRHSHVRPRPLRRARTRSSSPSSAPRGRRSPPPSPCASSTSLSSRSSGSSSAPRGSSCAPWASRPTWRASRGASARTRSSPSSPPARRARRADGCWRSSSSASCASRSARRATRWCRGSTSCRCPSRRRGAAAEAFVRTHQYSRVLLTNGRSLDEVAGYLYAKDFLLHPDAGGAARPASPAAGRPLRPGGPERRRRAARDAAQADPDRGRRRRVRRARAGS